MSPKPVPPSIKGIYFHRLFEKDWLKLQFQSTRDHFLAKIIPVFFSDPHNKSLRNHSIGGKYPGLRGIDVTGDVRAFYYQQEDHTVTFVRIGTHSQLYG